jgi:hypothetical protein
MKTGTKTTAVERGNEIAARIIVADPVKYAGLPLMWALLWMERHQREVSCKSK